MSRFKIGQVVSLKSDNAIKGAVISIFEEQPETRYQLFTALGMQTYYESQLEEEEIINELQAVDAERFHAGITASLIRNPSLTSLYSLNSAKIDFIPHQFRPVLKFIRSDRPRLLIADGVGVGKTIEAGLIIKEMQARRNLDSILIICPRPLVSERKWEMEMERFGEEFTALDGETFRYCISELDIEGEWPEKYKKAVIPYSLFDEQNVFGNRKHPGLMEVEPPKFDLVIVDEAHHIRNTATYAYKAVDRFCDTAEAVVFLTATPVQLDQDDLFVLLNLLRPDLIIDKRTFYEMAEPNVHINAAATAVRRFGCDWKEVAFKEIMQAEGTAWGMKVFPENPVFRRIVSTLTKEIVSPEERVQLISDIEGLHTFSCIISRTRRRDIGEFTVRKPNTVTVEFTEYQRTLHNKILSVIHDILSEIHCTDNTKFMMTTIRRQTASCLFGLAPMLRSILYHHINEITDDDESTELGLFDIDQYEDIRARIEEILTLSKNLPDEDPKFDAMLEVIRKKQNEPKNKIMIFSSFKHTLRYLEKKLSRAGYRVGMIHGEVSDEDRRSFRKRFNPSETPNESREAIDILLFSEVGCEGLDYQFCDCMINYDLPWNPMKVEQRIGRIDRNGQTSENVSIYNMVTPGTVDADIYERCLMRIGVFHNSIGDCEEILGEITDEINELANNFSLTDQERRVKLQQMTDNKIRYMKEQEELEEKQKDLFGLHVPESVYDDELKSATNYWLSADMLQNMVLCYLRSRLSQEREKKEYLLGAKALKKLRLSREDRITLLEDYKQKRFPRNETTKKWRKWLEIGDQLLDVTFESNCWKDNPDITFFSITHPLVQTAADYLQSKGRIATVLSTESNVVTPGAYPFAIYQWKLSGEREDLQLKPLSADDKLNVHLLDLLESSGGTEDEIPADGSAWKQVDHKHHEIWEKALEEHRSWTNELINYKEASLRTSHAARMAILRDLLRKSKNRPAFYIRMTEAKINNAQNDFDHHLSLLNEARNRSDILFELLAYGVLNVKKQSGEGI